MLAVIIIGALIGAFLILSNPFIGLLATVVLIPLSLVPALGGGFLGIFTAATPIKLIGAVTFIGVVFKQMSGGKNWDFLKEPTVKIYNFFVIYILLNGLIMPCSFTRENFTFYVSIAIFGLIVVTQVTTVKRLRLVLWVFMSCVFVVSVQAIMNYNVISQLNKTARVAGSTFDPNYFAISLLPFLAISFYNIGVEKNKLLKLLSLGYSLTYLAALAVTQSRGGFIGLVVMAFLAFVTAKRKFAAMILVLIGSVLVFNFMPDHFWKRFSETKLEAETSEELYQGAVGSTVRRYYLALAAWEMFLDYPVFGVGIGNYYWECVKYYPIWAGRAHNMHLEIMAELGIVGTALFIGLLVAFFKCLRRLGKAGAPYNLLAKSFLIGHVGFLVTALFLHAQQDKGFWMIMFLAVAMERMWRKEQQSQQDKPAPVKEKRPPIESSPPKTKWGKRKLGY